MTTRKLTSAETERMMTLVPMVMAGDSGLLPELLHLTEIYLSRIALSKAKHSAVFDGGTKVLDYDLAGEMVHITLITVAEKLSTLKDPGKYRGWVTMILSHKFDDEYERRNNVIPMSQFREGKDPLNFPGTYMGYDYRQSEGMDTARIVEHRETREELLRAMSRLSKGEQDVIRLYYWGSYKEREIADILHIPEGTVKSRKYNALRKLRGFLEPTAA